MKNTYLTLLLSTVFLSPAAWGQKHCDTLVTKDGRLISIEVVSNNSEGLLYTKCNEVSERQYFLEKGKILEIRSKNPIPKKTLQHIGSETEKEAPVSSPLRMETDLHNPKTILWLGLAIPNLVFLDLDYGGSAFLRFGAETGFKNSPLRLEALVQPIFNNYRRNSYYTDFKPSGINGQLGVVLKSFTKGRLTGNVSKGYWGFDLYWGRHAYQYSSSSTTPQNTEVKTTWTSLMPRIGYQFSYGMMAFDIALPIGYQWYRHTQKGSNATEYTVGTLSLQPSASIGLRF